MKPFTNPNDPDNVALKATLARWVKAKLTLETETTVEFTEIACAEPSCVHTETFIEIENLGGNNARFKIAKPLVFIRKWDIDAMKETPRSLDSSIHKH
jgi:hypothetical protein